MEPKNVGKHASELKLYVSSKQLSIYPFNRIKFCHTHMIRNHTHIIYPLLLDLNVSTDTKLLLFDVDAGHRAPEVPPPPRQHTCLHGLPCGEEGQDDVEDVVHFKKKRVRQFIKQVACNGEQCKDYKDNDEQEREGLG
jgi:hypothetical protein